MTTGKEYGKMTKNASPPSPKIKNIINAFWTGGLICTISQALNALYTKTGFSEDEVNAGVSVTLIVIAACLTGLGVYDKIIFCLEKDNVFFTGTNGMGGIHGEKTTYHRIW